MSIQIVLECDELAQSYSVYRPELPVCTSCGDTEKEAMKKIHEAIKLYLEPSTAA
jgi:predicted RNase H-like HicB family nuclease